MTHWVRPLASLLAFLRRMIWTGCRLGEEVPLLTWQEEEATMLEGEEGGG